MRKTGAAVGQLAAAPRLSDALGAMRRVGDLPSSIHAQAFTRAPGLGTGAWVGVDVIVRGLLIAAGIRAFSRPGARARTQGIAGAMGIEVFVLGWTYLTDRGSP